jgi:Do/DeqQ family serine protease
MGRVRAKPVKDSSGGSEMREPTLLRPRAFLAAGLGFLVIGVAIGLALSGSLQLNPTTEAQSRATIAPAPASGSLESPFTAVVERALPAVVLIEARKKTSRSTTTDEQDPFEMFRRMMPNTPHPRLPDTYPSSGSGFVFDRAGRILTNNHVVRDAEEITVTLTDKRTFKATIVGQDAPTDVAVIQLTSREDLPTLPLGDSDAIRVGDWAIAVGNPLGELQGTVTAGIISAKGRSALNIMGGGPDYQDFIQTDAAINFGNSGGPLLNIRGEVVGINTAINQSGQGIGFAIPINLAKHIAEQLLAHGKVVRGYMGVLPSELTPDLAESYGLKTTEGVVVSQVVKDSPAARAGLKEGDIVTAFDGRKIKDLTDFRLKVADAPVDKSVRVDLLRNGQPRSLYVTLANRDVSLASQQGGRAPSEDDGGSAGDTQAASNLGLDVRAMTQSERGEIGEDGVVVRDVAEGSVAADQGIEPGDLILQVNGSVITDRGAFQAEMRRAASSKRPARLLMGRVLDDGSLTTRFVALRFAPR